MCFSGVLGIVSLFAKQSKTLILKFTKDHVYILAEPEVTDRSMKLWTEVPQSTLFSHYEIVGVPPDNTIYLKTKAENLMNSLKTATNCRSLKIKLRQRTTPCLSLEFEQSVSNFNIQYSRFFFQLIKEIFSLFQSQLTTKNRIIYNYIDVEVVYKRFWARYDEPNLPPPDVINI